MLTRRFMGIESDGTIVVTLPANGRPADPAAITALVRKRLPRAKLESVSQSDRETVVSYNFQGIADNALAGFQAELNAAAGPSSYNVFFNRPGAL
jgi:predicted ribosome quality control (RQC) complex YloA/Tae2 family protein